MTEVAMVLDEPSDPQAARCACGSGYETLLRCQKCEKPICPKCAVRHPVGLRCREHATQGRGVLYDLRVTDYAVAAGVGLLVASAAGALVSHLLFFPIFLGSAIGSYVAATMSRAVCYKRGRGLQVIAGVCIVLGAVLGGGVADLALGIGVAPSLEMLARQTLSPVMWLYMGLAVYGAAGRLH